jgi:hypothetical protein
MSSDVNKHLWDLVDLGIEAEAFLKSRLGEHVRRQSISDIDDAFDKFVDVDSKDEKAVRELQFKALVGRKLFSLFENIQAAGAQAAQTLEDLEHE